MKIIIPMAEIGGHTKLKGQTFDMCIGDYNCIEIE